MNWEQVLRARGPSRIIGRARPHLNKQALVDSQVEPAIDVATMSATAVISTPTPDRSDDVVDPLGMHLDNYRRNPLVFYDHGQSGIELPIAKSEDPSGASTIKATARGVTATSYFAQGMREACQVFDLVEQKIIRCASVNITPILANVRSEGKGLRPGLHIEYCELLEWSWVGIPDNPEAVRKVLDLGKLAGSAICEPIRKSLAAFAAKPKLLGKGYSPTAAPRRSAISALRVEIRKTELMLEIAGLRKQLWDLTAGIDWSSLPECDARRQTGAAIELAHGTIRRALQKLAKDGPQSAYLDSAAGPGDVPEDVEVKGDGEDDGGSPDPRELVRQFQDGLARIEDSINSILSNPPEQGVDHDAIDSWVAELERMLNEVENIAPKSARADRLSRFSLLKAQIKHLRRTHTV